MKLLGSDTHVNQALTRYDMIRGAARIIPVLRHFPQVGE